MRILLIHNRYKQAGGEDSVFRAEKSLLSAFGEEVDQIVYDNSIIKTFLDKCRFGLKALYNSDSAHTLRAKIKDFQPDVIHVHNFLPVASPSVFMEAGRSGVPVVFTLHNYRMICPSATLFYQGHIYEKSVMSILPIDAILKGVYRNSKTETAIVALMILAHRIIGTWKNKVSGYITLTQFARKKFEDSSLRIKPFKLFVKPNFVVDSGDGSVEREEHFLFIGRLAEEKGIRTLINAAASHDFKLVIIGDGPLTKIVEDCVLQNPNVCFMGFQPKEVIMNYLKSSKALIFPSIWYEGFPVTIAEAFSTGTPVIASNLGSMAEIIQHNVNGLLFEAGNENDMISKIIEISGDKKLAKRLSSNARRSYLEHYTPEKNYSMLMNIYKTVIERQAMSGK